MILVYHGSVDHRALKCVSANDLVVDIVVSSATFADLGMLDSQESTATHKGIDSTTARGLLCRGTDFP